MSPSTGLAVPPSPLSYVLACLAGAVVGGILGLGGDFVLVLLCDKLVGRYTFDEAGHYLISLAIVVCLPLGSIIGGVLGISKLTRFARH